MKLRRTRRIRCLCNNVHSCRVPTKKIAQLVPAKLDLMCVRQYFRTLHERTTMRSNTHIVFFLCEQSYEMTTHLLPTHNGFA